MPVETGISAVVRPNLDERSTDKEVSRLENKIDAATDANVDLGMTDPGAMEAPGGGVGAGGARGGGGGLLGGAVAGGVARVALAGAVGYGLLQGISALAGEHAPLLQQKLDMVNQGLGLVAGAFGEKLAEYLPAKEFWNGAKSFYETAQEEGLDVAVTEGLEGVGEGTLESVGLGDLVEDTGAEQLIGGTVGAAALIGTPLAAGALIQGGMAAGSLIIGGVSAGTLITGSVAAGSLIAGTIAADALIDTATGGESGFGEAASGAFSFVPGIEGPDKQRQQEIGAAGFGTFAGTMEDLGLRSDLFRSAQVEKLNRAQTPIGERGVNPEEIRGGSVGGLDTTLRGTDSGAAGQAQFNAAGGTAPTGGGEGGEQADEVSSKLDEVVRELQNLDLNVSLNEQDLARGVNSAEATFGNRRDRDNN
jgi:hypothetical protein